MSAAFGPKPRLLHSFSGYVPPLLERENSQIQVTYDEKRRAALEEVDGAAFSRAWLPVSGFSHIGIAETMIGLVYGNNGKLNPKPELALKLSTQVGIFFGQVIFGWLADAVGRKKMYGFELVIGEAQEGRTVNIIVMLSIWRFVMGIGIGADYPLSSVITSEFSPKHIRGRMMTTVFAMQGFGNFAAALVALVVTKAYQSQINDEGAKADAIDRCWRLLIGLGAVPGCIALYCRLTIPEIPRFTMYVEQNIEQAVQDVDTFLCTGTYNIYPDARKFKLLLAMAYTWFALDVAFHTLGLNTPGMIKSLGYVSKACDDHNAKNSRNILYGVSKGNLILAAGGLIPGYWATFCFIDSWGRKPIQLIGSVVLTVLPIAIGIAWDPLHEAIGGYGGGVLISLYCLANFFQNFGPNTTTFIVPGEAFPTRYRATAHAISAASGKLGAIVSQAIFSLLKGRFNSESSWNDPDPFVKYLMYAFAFFTLSGAAATLLIEETRGRTLEDISNEDQDRFIENPGPLELGPHDIVGDVVETLPLQRMPSYEA
ncbi:phosphate transporter [Rhizoctonia solani]|nr:phosphate transporter [Rhizoctonia solani]